MPGDAVLNAETKDGTYKLILACLYVLVGTVSQRSLEPFYIVRLLHELGQDFFAMKKVNLPHFVHN